MLFLIHPPGKIVPSIRHASADFTVLLRQWAEGDRSVEPELFEIAYPRLRRIAAALLRREANGHSLQSVDLVNQIYLRLNKAAAQNWRDRQHFFAFTGRMMRRYLIDHARARPDAKFVMLDGMEGLLKVHGNSLNLAITIDQLLEELGEENREWCTIVELKYFLGLTDESAAQIMKMPERTLQRKWRDARKWLFLRLEHRSARKHAAGNAN